MSIGHTIASGLASGVAMSATAALVGRLPPKRAGVAAPPSGPDPVADAVKNLGAIQAYMAAVVTPAGATAEQLQAAQQAVQALASDLIQVQRGQQGQQLPAGTWVKGGAAVAGAAGALAVGGVAGWLLRGRKEGSR